MQNKAWIAAAGRLAAYVCALFIAAATTLFVWRDTLFVATADAWGFIATFLPRYYAGTLTLADFFAKRDSLDHSQPLQKVLFLVYARFLDLDLSFEALTGIAFGLAFVAVIVAIVRADAAGQPRAKAVAALTTLGATAIVFSLNDEGVFDWSLATLSLFYPLGVALMLVFANRCIERESVWPLAIGVVVACVLLDTSAVLGAAAIVVLIALRWRSFARASIALQLAGAVIAAAALYVLAYSLAFASVQSSIAMGARIDALAAHAGEAWKALVVPLGAVVMSPHRIKQTYGVDAYWTWLVPAAVVLAIGHAWFWREVLRRRDTRLAFVAAGLMLYFYATLAGIVWARVPRFGFDYFMQSRYLVFYALQLVAILMIAASKAARSGSTAAPFLACTAGVLALAGIALAYGRGLDVAAHVNFNRNLDRQLIALAEDPAHVSPDCPVAHLALCNWILPARAATLDLMRREQLNVFSPRFRERHDLPPLPAALQPPPAQ